MKNNFLLALFFIYAASSPAQVPNLLIYDHHQSQHFGASNIVTAHKLIYHHIEQLIPIKLWEEDNWLKKSGGIGYRAIKLGVTGFQVDVNAVLYQHEVFGHGSRMREFEFDNLRYSFKHFFPFDFGGTAGGTSTYPITFTQGLMISAGGVEGDLVLSEELEERFLTDGKLHYRQSLLFLVARNNLARYAKNNLTNSGDISSYISNLNRSLGPTSTNGEMMSGRKLFHQSLVVLLNPMQWYAMWNLGKNYLIDGESIMAAIPMIKWKNTSYLPSLNYNLTPFGGEFILNNYFLKNGRLLLVKARIGDATFRHFYGGGVKMLNLVNKETLKVNTAIDMWYQPSFTIGLSTGINSVQEALGFMIQSSFSYFPLKNNFKLGIHGQVGYKTRGYLMGENLDKGLVVRLGLAINVN